MSPSHNGLNFRLFLQPVETVIVKMMTHVCYSRSGCVCCVHASKVDKTSIPFTRVDLSFKTRLGRKRQEDASIRITLMFLPSNGEWELCYF